MLLRYDFRIAAPDKTMKLTLVALCTTALLACAPDPAEKYVGTWSNTYLGGQANVEIVVSNDGGNLYVEERVASTHVVLERTSAKVVDGYLTAPQGFSFTKATYSPQQDTLIWVEGPLNNVPPFKRVH